MVGNLFCVYTLRYFVFTHALDTIVACAFLGVLVVCGDLAFVCKTSIRR